MTSDLSQSPPWLLETNGDKHMSCMFYFIQATSALAGISNSIILVVYNHNASNSFLNGLSEGFPSVLRKWSVTESDAVCAIRSDECNRERDSL